MHTFAVQLADVDRGVYDDFTLRVARHPSETDLYMVTRLLAYCLEYVEGIAFSEGAPDAARLHYGSKLAERVAIYTHRDPAKVSAAWAGKKIHRSEAIVFRSFDVGFIGDAAAALERRNAATVSLIDGQLYLDLNGTNLSTALHEHEIS